MVPGMTTASVAVIIPAYKAAATIDGTLASVAAQSLAPAEVVVADDGSPDETVEVARRWSALLPLQVVRLERNAGPAAARRAAIARTSAPSIALLDADDIWLPDHVESLMRVQESRGGIACADMYRWYPGEDIRSTHLERHPIAPPEQQMLAVLRDNFVSIAAAFPRDAYERVGGFRDGFSGAEDWDLWIRLIRAGLRVHGTQAASVLYRISAGGLTQRAEIFDTYARVLEFATREAGDDEERAVASAGMRRWRTRSRLAAAYREARAGHRAGARRAAAECLSGPRRMAAEAALIAVAPRLTARLGDAVRHRRR